MAKESLNQLIQNLRHLHLEQVRILQALENAIDDVDDGAEHVEPNTTPVPTVVVQAPPVAAVLAPVPTVVVPEPTVFHIGQRVYITNRITHVLTRCATEADRTAIVTHFTASFRIGIRTLNGFHTHRHSKNLRPLN